MLKIIQITILLLIPIKILSDNLSPNDLVNNYYIERSQYNIKQILKKKNIIGLEYLLKNSGKEVETFWGHSALRIIDDDDNDLNDYVIDFLALTGDDNYKVLYKGALGSYKLFPNIKQLATVLLDNNTDSQRYFKRVPLFLSSTQLKKIAKTIKKWINSPNSSPNYYFHSVNCSYALLYLFKKTNIPFYTGFNPFRVHTPRQTIRQLYKSGLSLVSSSQTYSSAMLIDKLEVHARKIKTYNKNQELLDSLLKALTNKELYIVVSTGIFDVIKNKYIDSGFIKYNLTKAYLRRKELYKFSFSLNSIYKIKKFPRCYYDSQYIDECLELAENIDNKEVVDRKQFIYSYYYLAALKNTNLYSLSSNLRALKKSSNVEKALKYFRALIQK